MKHLSTLFVAMTFFAVLNPATRFDDFGSRPAIVAASKKHGNRVVHQF